MLAAAFDRVTLLAYLVAFGGGILSFLTPCTLPLLPVYLSTITGLDLAELQRTDRKDLATIVTTTGLFMLGLGVVFIPLGFASSALGSFLFDNRATLQRVSGVIMLAMAALMALSVTATRPGLVREVRFHPSLVRFGRAAPLVAGLAFGFGWSPCIGPILGTITGIAAAGGRAWAGATLLAVYTLGLGLPFLVCGLALGRLTRVLGWWKRHMRVMVLGSAAVLAVFAVLLMADQLSLLTREISEITRRLGIQDVVG